MRSRWLGAEVAPRAALAEGATHLSSTAGITPPLLTSLHFGSLQCELLAVAQMGLDVVHRMSVYVSMVHAVVSRSIRLDSEAWQSSQSAPVMPLEHSSIKGSSGSPRSPEDSACGSAGPARPPHLRTQGGRPREGRQCLCNRLAILIKSRMESSARAVYSPISTVSPFISPSIVSFSVRSAM